MQTIAETPPPPDEAAAGDDVRCPLCEYDLRGLTEPRCPECGYRFAWADLRDPSRRLHRYLFEHHPERNVWSFVRTHLGGLRPKRFWTSLLPQQPSRPRRLVLYWLLAVLPLVPVLVVHHLAWFRREGTRARFEKSRILKLLPPGSAQEQDIISQSGSVQAWMDQICPVPPSRDFYRRAWRDEHQWALYLAAVMVAWPWLTFLTLLLFRFSMRRARIKPVHVLRCVLYSFDAILWLGVAAAGAAAASAYWAWLETPQMFALPAVPIPRYPPYGYRQDLVPNTLFWVGMALLLLMAYRLTAAFRHYLKFDRPAATILASQVIVALAVLVWTVNGFMPR
jgi:hypothetical protein